MDIRTIKWTLIPRPEPIISIVLVYLYIIYVAGPRFMKNRQPYSLKIFMQCYNVLQVVVNLWVMLNILMNGNPFAVLWKYCDSIDEMYGHNTEKVR